MAEATSIEIAPETIGHILHEKALRVPLSQRSYRWEKEHIEDLYTDIYGALIDEAEEYFLGSIVGIKSNGARYIYDGQQRLATSMILLAAIRDYFSEAGDETTAGEIENDHLISRHRKTHELTAHFSLNAEDQDFFHNRILLRANDPIRKATKAAKFRESHKRIERAAVIAKKFVKESIISGLAPSKARDNLHRWLDFIDENLRVIWVQVADERTAFRIFETMNDRGLRLSAADLLKNHLYAEAGTRQNEVIQKWQSMTGVLETIEGEEENIVEFIRCYWVTANGPTRTKVLYDQIKEKTTNKTKAVALATDLESVSHDYAAILLSSHEKWASRGANIRMKIEVLRSLGVTQVRPLLLAGFRKFSATEFEKLLDGCLSWSVRCVLSGVPSGTLEGFYSRNAYKITQGTIKKTAQVKSDMIKIVPNNRQFEASVCYAKVANQQLARYYLRALQRCKDGEPEPQYVPNPGSEITLEHILPSAAGVGWEHLSTEEKKDNLTRLGNEALLTGTVNSKLGNVAYDIKKPALKASAYSLTKMAANFTSWGAPEITARQEELAKLAVKTWPM
jgi:Protein of unknown function DUF262/Protein of unknown function (DUF1524)